MTETILQAQGHEIIEIPREAWDNHLAEVSEKGEKRLAFMSEIHHKIRYFLVSELPRLGTAITPPAIAQHLQLPLAQVYKILDELEENLLFLVRDKQGAVAWAYPLTLQETAHRLKFDSGETLYAA